MYLCLQQEIRMHNCASIIGKVPLLQDVDQGFLTSVVMALRKMLVPVYEVLLLEREPPAALFFINAGGVSVLAVVRSALRRALISHLKHNSLPMCQWWDCIGGSTDVPR